MYTLEDLVRAATRAAADGSCRDRRMVSGLRRPPAALAGAQALGQVGLDLVDGDAVLAHAVAIPDRYRLGPC